MLLVVICCHQLLLPGHQCCAFHLKSVRQHKMFRPPDSLYLQLEESLVKFQSGEYMHHNATLLSTVESLLVLCLLGFYKHIFRGSLPSIWHYLVLRLIIRFYWLVQVLMGGELGNVKISVQFLTNNFLWISTRGV